jgi:hypothetical protein
VIADENETGSDKGLCVRQERYRGVGVVGGSARGDCNRFGRDEGLQGLR